MEELISGCESGLQPSYKFFLSYFNKLCGEAYQNKLFLDYSSKLHSQAYESVLNYSLLP